MTVVNGLLATSFQWQRGYGGWALFIVKLRRWRVFGSKSLPKDPGAQVMARWCAGGLDDDLTMELLRWSASSLGGTCHSWWWRRKRKRRLLIQG